MNANTPCPACRTERYDTIVIGGGQAGLAVGYHLSKRDVDFVILDSASRIGDSWRRRWDSLRLFTPAAFSGLPGMPFPAPRMHLPDKDEVADYLERYAERFDLPVRKDTHVASLSRRRGRYFIQAGSVQYEAQNVIVATGPFHKPRIPALSAELSADIRQLHSSDYRNQFDLPLGPVLVVGAGNSGAQIALELARFRPVTLAGSSTGYLPRKLAGRDIYSWIWPLLTRLTIDTRLGRRLRRRLSHDPLIGINAKQFANAGVKRSGRVTEVRGGLPVVDGEVMNVKSVIWCTGFSPDFSWIELPLIADRGAPQTSRGVVPEYPGLYFVGLRFLHSLTSALVGGVGADAEYIAHQVGVIDSE